MIRLDAGKLDGWVEPAQPKGFTYEEEGHRYRIGDREILSVTTAIDEVGLVSPFAKRYEIAGERGDAVHLACLYYDEGVLNEDTVDNSVRPYLDAWIDFRQKKHFIPIIAEEPGFHRARVYAGTPDRAGELEAEPWVLEIKSGSQVPRWADLQVAAYHALFPFPKAFGEVQRGVVHLRKNGAWRLRHCQEKDDLAVFLSILNLARWKRRRRRRS